jgi:hypothetical protein
MKKLNFKYWILSVIVSSLHLISYGQHSFTLNESESKLTITGTSTVHDWEIDISKFTTVANLAVKENQEIMIEGINFICQVENIKSDNRIMNNKTYDALKGDDFPEIKFNANENVNVPLSSPDAQIKGKLSIAGQTKDVALQFSLANVDQNQIEVKGESKLKMSDFGIEPPTAMLGTLKTGDDIVITYNIILQKTQEIN